MATAIKVTNGQLPNAAADLLLAGVGETIGVKSIILVNASVAAKTTNLYLKKSGGATTRIWEKDYSLAAGLEADLQTIVFLEAGDSIQGDASAAASVDYTISYIVET